MFHSGRLHTLGPAPAPAPQTSAVALHAPVRSNEFSNKNNQPHKRSSLHSLLFQGNASKTRDLKAQILLAPKSPKQLENVIVFK